MKTPTLLVRLIGLYLLFKASAFFYVFWQVDRQVAIAAQKHLSSSINHMVGLAIIGFILGLMLTAKAGRVAALLTSDSE